MQLATIKFCSSCRLLALRKAEKEEEKRAREKIKQKLEEDKVSTFPNHFVLSLDLLLSQFLPGF